VLLDALVDYGGTLIFVSHDRYFVERLATKIIEIGNGTAVAFPGTYKEFLYHKAHAHEGLRAEGSAQKPAAGRVVSEPPKKKAPAAPARAHAAPKQDHDEKKRVDAEARKKQKAAGARQARIATLEARIADTEAAIREVEQQMSAPGFYEDRVGAQPVIDRHQSLMWQVGDLMNQWEELHTLSDLPAKTES
jgi:ATP-binding cassette subfamily F protein 3